MRIHGINVDYSRALLTRDLNRERQRVKNEIIDAFGDGFKDCNVNYDGGKE